MWVSGLDPGSPRLSELQGVVPEAWLKRACVPGLQSATCGRPPARGRQASPCRVGPAVTRKRSGSGSGVGAGRMAADTQVRLAAAGPTRRAAGPERGQRGRDCPGAGCGADGRGGRRRRRRGGGLVPHGSRLGPAWAGRATQGSRILPSAWLRGSRRPAGSVLVPAVAELPLGICHGSPGPAGRCRGPLLCAHTWNVAFMSIRVRS